MTFPDVVIDEATTLTFQLGTVPAVSSAGNGKTADALFTVHYGSVQYPSRVALP